MPFGPNTEIGSCDNIWGILNILKGDLELDEVGDIDALKGKIIVCCVICDGKTDNL